MAEREGQRGARGGEPSMEEILASIKRIIAEDTPARSSRRESSDDVLELTEEAAIAPASPAESARGEDAQDTAEPPLLAEDTAACLRGSLAALATLSEPGAAPQIVRQGETSLEGLVREMLRPMLKEWLNTNLPPMVEAIVAREIQRIVKR